MAKRRTVAAGKTELVVVNAGGGGVARRRSSGGIRRRSSGGGGKRRRRSGHSGGAAHSIQAKIQSMSIGGFMYGQLVKNFPTLPQIPGLGRAGSVAALVYFLKPSSTLLQNVGIAAAVLAGNSFGQTGTVAGDDDETIQG